MYMQMYNQLSTEEHMKKWIDQMNMEWENYDDFERKFGSDVDPGNFARRYSLMYIYDGIGYLLQEKQMDIDTALYYLLYTIENQPLGNGSIKQM